MNAQPTTSSPTIRRDQLFVTLQYLRTHDFFNWAKETQLDLRIRELLQLENLKERSEIDSEFDESISCWTVYQDLLKDPKLEETLQRVLIDKETSLSCSGIAAQLWHNGQNRINSSIRESRENAETVQAKLEALFRAVGAGEITFPLTSD